MQKENGENTDKKKYETQGGKDICERKLQDK